MLDFKRPGTGLEPNNYSTLLGKIADKDIQKDEMISYDNIKKD